MLKNLTSEIFKHLDKNIDWNWDGKQSILHLKKHTNQWKQMEWQGFFWEEIGTQILANEMDMKIPGPKYGNVTIDTFLEIPWDFKAHNIHNNNENINKDIPTNGYKETKECLKEYTKIGFIIASGKSQFESTPGHPFKQWHDELKGEKSKYVIDGIKNNRNKRRRKVDFTVLSVDFIILDMETIDLCGKFQEGMVNSNGTLRKAKLNLPFYEIINNKIPEIEYYRYKINR
tara:strand:+ start:412 stop:1101 length:690 start_codon:yes stop_codon:yes gene_type:complete